MKKTSKIFMSGLKARLDDMLAAALLIAAKPELEFTEIIRDEERSKEATENDFIIGCGGESDGTRKFDPRKIKSKGRSKKECALGLVAKAFVPELMADKKFAHLMKYVLAQETSGIPADKKQFGVSQQEHAYGLKVSSFEKMPLTVAEEVANDFREKLAKADEVKEVENWLEENAHIEWQRFIIKVLVCDESPFKKGFSKSACKEAVKRYAKAHKICVLYGWKNDGSDIRTLYGSRFGKKCLDFTKAVPGDAVLCHKGGVIFKPKNELEYRQLIDCAAGFPDDDDDCGYYDGDWFIFKFNGREMAVQLWDPEDWILTPDDEDYVEA